MDLSWPRVGMVDTHEGDTRGVQDLEADARQRFGGAAKAHAADTRQTHDEARFGGGAKPD